MSTFLCIWNALFFHLAKKIVIIARYFRNTKLLCSVKCSCWIQYALRTTKIVVGLEVILGKLCFIKHSSVPVIEILIFLLNNWVDYIFFSVCIPLVNSPKGHLPADCFELSPRYLVCPEWTRRARGRIIFIQGSASFGYNNSVISILFRFCVIFYFYHS